MEEVLRGATNQVSLGYKPLDNREWDEVEAPRRWEIRSSNITSVVPVPTWIAAGMWCQEGFR